MSMYYQRNKKRYVPTYKDGRTKQAFKDDCDINKILAKAQIQGSLSHLEKHGAFYADYSEAPTNLLEAHSRIERGQRVFDELPSEIRREFNNDQFAFFEFVNAPENKDRLPEIFPEIAKPGNYFPDIGQHRLRASVTQETPKANTEAQDTTNEPTENNTESTSA